MRRSAVPVTLSALALNAIAPPAVAQPCDDFGLLRSGGIAISRLCVGNTVFVGTQDNGVQVYGISTPGAPEPLAWVQTRDRAAGFAASGDTLYIADAFGGLFIVDISDPSEPIEIGTVDTGGDPVGWIEISGSTAYAVGEKLWVYDLADPHAPALLADLALPDYASKALVAGDSLIAFDLRDSFDDTSELFLIDVSDPTDPVLGPDIVAETGLFDFAISGDTLATFSGTDALFFDIADPTTPALLAQLPLAGMPVSISAGATHAYVQTNNAPLQVFDLSDPNAIAQSGTVEGVFGTVSVSGGKLLSGADPSGVTVRSIDDPGNPAVETSIPFVITPTTLSFSGQTAYAPDGRNGISILGVTDPQTPFAIGLTPVPDAVIASAVRGDRLYVVDVSEGILTYDISDPTSPVRVPSGPLPFVGRQMRIVGDTLLLAESDGLLSVAIEPDGSLGAATLSPASRFPDDMALQGSRAYLAGDELDIFDITDPRSPVLTATLTPLPEPIRGIASSDGRLAIVSGNNSVGRLTLMTLDDPDAPQIIGAAEYARKGTGVRIEGDSAAVAVDRNGLSFFDLSDPSNIVEIANLPHPADTRTLDRRGSFLYLGLEGGLATIDASCFGFPCAPADLAEPLGVLDLADIVSFVTAFVALDPAADFDENGLFDLADITAFVAAFSAGCP